MKHICQKTEIINELAGKVKTIKTLGEESYALSQKTYTELEEHREAQKKHEKERLVYREKREGHDIKLSNELETIKLALFGNEELGIAGDHQLITEMHALLVQGNTIKKFMVWAFGSIMAIIAAVALIARLIKDAK